MATVNNGGQNRHDGQKNYQNSNERNRDAARSNTEKHQYKEHDETLTNDANFDSETQQPTTEMEFDDKLQNSQKQPGTKKND